MVRISALAMLLGAVQSTEAAQESPVVPTDVLSDAWRRAMDAAGAGLASATTPEARVVVYESVITRLVNDPEIARRRDGAEYHRAIERMAAALPDGLHAKSVNGTLGNLATGLLVERSGLTELLAVATDFDQLFASNDSAISLNLNALAVVGGGANGAYSAPYRYRERESLRRLGGTVTFGAKVPESEITGFTGVPSANTLFDVFVWDVKVRVLGDRDPRATRWYTLLQGFMGDTTELTARVSGLPQVPVQDAGLVARAAGLVLKAEHDRARRAIGSSLQASVKTSGQHLTREAGRNTFTVAGMLDKGVGTLDLTLNVAYSVLGEMRVGATDPFRAKELRIGGALVGSLLADVLVPRRSAELNATFLGRLAVDGDDVPIDRKHVWTAGLSLILPFQRAAKVPISITYSNDPNNPVKARFITGHIGVSYDFGALLRPLGQSGVQQ